MRDAVTVRCPSCSRAWNVPCRADKTYPATARCALSRGGCGKVVKVPQPADATPAAKGHPERSKIRHSVAEFAEWNPPSEPRGFGGTAGTCSDCHAAVKAEPRGTALWCSGCGSVLTPPAALAPYRRGTGVARAAKSQRERDLEALDLARRKGIMRGQLAALAADDRLTPDSAAIVEWFAEQVKAAGSGARLDELAGLVADAGIRRRHFWQGKPAALTSGYAGEDDDEEPEDDGQEHEAAHAAPAAVLGLGTSIHSTGQPRRMTWGEALAACGWRLSPITSGTCQLTDQRGQLCGQDAPRHIGAGWLCEGHHAALSRVIQQRTA